MSDSVVVRKLPPGVKQGLRERAAAHGRSVEAEIRQILVEVVFPPDDFVLAWIEGAHGLPEGPDLDLPRRQPGRAPVDFE
jgi:antitoxin FitA